ncbi:Paired amphipathic helix protein Sin3b [Dirofilaria immitis]
MGQFMIPVDIKDKTVVSKDIRHEIMMLEDDEGMMAKDEVDETMESVEEIVASKNWAVEEKDEIMISTDDNNMIPMHAVMILSGEDTISVDQAMRLIEDMQSKYEAMEVEDQIVLQLNDSMGSMDEVIVRKDKAMEIEDQVMILKSDNETTISLENRWNQLAKLIIPKGDQRIV